MNIAFEYLYRDAGNNKIWGEVIFRNTNNIDVLLLDTKIKNALIDKEFFVASQIGLPTLQFENYDEELDHDWHEYSTVKETKSNPTDNADRDICDFIEFMSIDLQKMLVYL